MSSHLVELNVPLRSPPIPDDVPEHPLPLSDRAPPVKNVESQSRALSVGPETPGPQPTSSVEKDTEFEPESSPEPTLTESSAAGTIDIDTFRQLLELDEDGDREFSRGMAWAYFTQASSTFKEMDQAFAVKDVAKLSSLGHFLKSSSAALGVAKVQASCEKLQHYGQLRDEEADADLTQEAALGKIEPLLKNVKGEYEAAEKWLKDWYESDEAKLTLASV